MKRCPSCGKAYTDETLNFCLDDGSVLADHYPEHATEILRDSNPLNDPSNEVIRSGEPTAILQNKRSLTSAAIIPIGVILLIGLGAVGYKVWNRQGAAGRPFASMKMSKLTANGKAIAAVISPDGKQVVYVREEGGLGSLWLRQIATGSEVQLTQPDNVFYRALTISPDGNFLYFANGPAAGPNQSKALYQMPLLGGAPRKLIDTISTPIGFSPDGAQIAFVRNVEGEADLLVARADGTGERKIASRPSPPSFSAFGNFGQGGVAWSPDGKRIALITANTDANGSFTSVVEVPAAGGEERLLTPQRWYQIERIAWLPDGSGLLMTGYEQAAEGSSQQVWYLAYPTGEAARIPTT